MTTAFRTFTKAVLLAGILAGGIALPAQAQDTGAQFFGGGLFGKCQSMEQVERSLKRMNYKDIEYRASDDAQHTFFFRADRKDRGKVVRWAIAYNYCKGKIFSKSRVELTP